MPAWPVSCAGPWRRCGPRPEGRLPRWSAGGVAFLKQRTHVRIMESRAKIAGHALHPMLVVFPLGLLATSLVWDICRLATGHPHWGGIAFWTIVAGVVGGLIAAVPGFIDWVAIPKQTRAKRVGFVHMILNLIVVGLFVGSLIARMNTDGGYDHAGVPAMILGWIGIALATVSGWLGGELIETLGISVREDAHPDAPSALHPHRGSQPSTRAAVPPSR